MPLIGKADYLGWVQSLGLDLARGSEVKKLLTTWTAARQTFWMENQHWIAEDTASGDMVIYPPAEQDLSAAIAA